MCYAYKAHTHACLCEYLQHVAISRVAVKQMFMERTMTFNGLLHG